MKKLLLRSGRGKVRRRSSRGKVKRTKSSNKSDRTIVQGKDFTSWYDNFTNNNDDEIDFFMFAQATAAPTVGATVGVSTATTSITPAITPVVTDWELEDITLNRYRQFYNSDYIYLIAPEGYTPKELTPLFINNLTGDEKEVHQIFPGWGIFLDDPSKHYAYYYINPDDWSAYPPVNIEIPLNFNEILLNIYAAPPGPGPAAAPPGPGPAAPFHQIWTLVQDYSMYSLYENKDGTMLLVPVNYKPEGDVPNIKFVDKVTAEIKDVNDIFPGYSIILFDINWYSYEKNGIVMYPLVNIDIPFILYDIQTNILPPPAGGPAAGAPPAGAPPGGPVEPPPAGGDIRNLWRTTPNPDVFQRKRDGSIFYLFAPQNYYPYQNDATYNIEDLLWKNDKNKFFSLYEITGNMDLELTNEINNFYIMYHNIDTGDKFFNINEPKITTPPPAGPPAAGPPAAGPPPAGPPPAGPPAAGPPAAGPPAAPGGGRASFLDEIRRRRGAPPPGGGAPPRVGAPGLVVDLSKYEEMVKQGKSKDEVNSLMRKDRALKNPDIIKFMEKHFPSFEDEMKKRRRRLSLT